MCKFQQQFQMSSIKSHLSVYSRPPQQPRNPSKLANQTLITNNSLSFSNALGRSHLKACNSLNEGSHIQNQMEQDEVLNLSITQGGSNITFSQINQIANLAKIIAFMAKQCQQKKRLIVNKSMAIRDLKSKISMMQEKTKFQTRQYQSKEKTLKSRSLSLKKHRKIISQRVSTQIFDMKVEIDWMKKAISDNKRSYHGRNTIVSTERTKRHRVYIPIPLPYNTHRVNSHDPSQRQSRKNTEYLHPYRQIHNQTNQVNTQQFLHRHQKDHSISFWNQQRHDRSINQSKRAQSNNMFPENATPSRNSQKRNESNGGILDFIQEKLQKGKNPQKSYMNAMQEMQRNPEFIQQSYQKQLGLVCKDSMDFHININEQNLEYLHDDTGDLRASQRSKKSIKNLKSSRGLVSKWKKDEQDKEIVELLKESMQNKSKKQHKQKSRYGNGQRSAIGAKLIVTDMGQSEYFIYNGNLEEKSGSKGRLVNLSNEGDSEEKKNTSESLDSRKRREEKHNIANSFVGIDLQDMSDSQDEHQAKVGLRYTTSKKQLHNQEEKSQQSTPNNFASPIHMLAPEGPKLLTPTNSSFSSLAEKSIEPPMTSLPKPPSILEQREDEYYDDEIESIKLATTSKHFDYQTPSKLIAKSQMNPQQQQEQDFLGGIRLQTTSRISRERLSSGLSNSQEQNIQEFAQFAQQPSAINTVFYSELRHSNNEDIEMEGMDNIDSQLRKSTNSIFVKKGASGIQKSVNRSRNSHSQTSNKSHVPSRSVSLLIGKSGGISNPIQQADEQEEEPSSIVRKYKRGDK